VLSLLANWLLFDCMKSKSWKKIIATYTFPSTSFSDITWLFWLVNENGCTLLLITGRLDCTKSSWLKKYKKYAPNNSTKKPTNKYHFFIIANNFIKVTFKPIGN
jgi:hypothetical protein